MVPRKNHVTMTIHSPVIVKHAGKRHEVELDPEANGEMFSSESDVSLPVWGSVGDSDCDADAAGA